MTYTITRISQAKKNPEHVNIELDGKYWVNCTKNDLVAFRIYQGKQIDDDEKSRLEELNNRSKLLEKIYNYISVRPRSIFEIKQYLTQRRKVEEPLAQELISELERKEVISDLNFANWYVDNRLNLGVHGIQKVRAELMQKRVSKSIIDQVLNSRKLEPEFKTSEEDKINSYIDKVIKTIKYKDIFELKRKLTMRLMSRGFTYDQVKSLVDQAVKAEVKK